MNFRGLFLMAACVLLVGAAAAPCAKADFGSFGNDSSAAQESAGFGTGAFGSSGTGSFGFGSSGASGSGGSAGEAAGSAESATPDTASAKTMGNSQAVIDVTNAASGSIKVKYIGGGSSRIKVQIVKNGTYNYDLNTKGKYETFPMNMGSGSYTVKVMKNISGNRYTAVYTASFSVQLTTEYAPYLTASQYVNYDEDTKVIAKAASLCRGKSNDLKKIDAIYDYVIDLLNYDTQKAKTVKSGYLPDLDAIYKSKKGICFDYAAMLAAMLRSQGIPTRLVTGYVGSEGLYHAWNEVYTKETGWVSKVISFDGKKWKLMDPTFASSGNSSDSIMDFIANTSNYRIKYTY